VKLFVALAALIFVSAAAPSQILLREQAWTPNADARAFLEEPAECLASRDIAVETGRALFRSPALLGGPAARAGLSCNACHSGGRRNARFLLPELTDRAGAVDVTSEWASKTRGDNIANPIDIPDLYGVTTRQTFGRLRDPSLEHFVHGVMVEEFQGQEPSAEVIAGVLAYLRALDEGECDRGVASINLASAAGDVRRALAVAERSDAPTARLLLLAAQDAVGRIVERLPARRFSRDRARFERLARELGALRRENVHALLSDAMPGWRARFDAAVTRVARNERRTYFNEATLRAALER
jgi:hypothetical protein